MQYVITYNDSVILGPIGWNPRLIAAAVQDELDLDDPPVVLLSDSSRVPYDILPNVRARRCELVTPETDELEQLVGPTWSFSPDVGTATWTKAPKPIELAKAQVKEKLAAVRYSQEVTPLQMQVGGQTVTIDTSRGAREFLTSTYQSMSVGDTVNWKFPECWVNVTRAQLLSIIVAIRQHVQSKFDWEMNQASAIDGAADHVALRALITSLFPPPVE